MTPMKTCLLPLFLYLPVTCFTKTNLFTSVTFQLTMHPFPAENETETPLHLGFLCLDRHIGKTFYCRHHGIDQMFEFFLETVSIILMILSHPVLKISFGTAWSPKKRGNCDICNKRNKCVFCVYY